MKEGFENIKETRINAVKINATPAWDPALQPGLWRGPSGRRVGSSCIMNMNMWAGNVTMHNLNGYNWNKSKQPNFYQSKNPPDGAALFNKADVILTRVSV